MEKRIVPSLSLTNVVLVLVLSLPCLNLSAQDMLWPGDINDNGIVNNVDLLYWGVAQGEKGPKRDERGTDWYAHTIADDWTDDYEVGLNYSQGDADGQGKIKGADRNAILKDNYGMVHGAVTPDVFLAGNPTTDPILLIEAQGAATVEPGEDIVFDISLGDATHAVDHYFGIAFTIHFDPAYVAVETNNPWNPSVAEFDLLANTWLNANGSSRSNEYMYLNEPEGKLDVVLLRKKLGDNSGHGQIAEFTIIMEDIVFLEDQNTSVSIDNIKLIDENMVEYPVAGSTEHFTILSNANALVSGNTGLVPASNTAVVGTGPAAGPAMLGGASVPAIDRAVTKTLEVKLFPNPSAEWLQIEQSVVVEQGSLKRINIYDANGVLVLQKPAADSPTQLINIAGLAVGNYYLHLYTVDGKSVVQFHKGV